MSQVLTLGVPGALSQVTHRRDDAVRHIRDLGPANLHQGICGRGHSLSKITRGFEAELEGVLFLLYEDLIESGELEYY